MEPGYSYNHMHDQEWKLMVSPFLVGKQAFPAASGTFFSLCARFIVHSFDKVVLIKWRHSFNSSPVTAQLNVKHF